jgi:protoporphyrinogen oxidase
MLGMTLALWLRDNGHRVTIVESAPELGGLASPWQIGDITWDRHYHVILNSDSHLLALLDRLDLSDELRWVETRTGVFAGGQLYSVSNSIEYLKFPPLRLVDKARLAWTILYASRLRDWRSLEQMGVEEWLRQHSGDRAFDSFWLPLLRSKLGDNYQKTSAAFIWTTIQRLYAARRSGLKREQFGYVVGGYSKIISRFIEVLHDRGVEIISSAKVEKITGSGQGVAVETSRGLFEFDRVVTTAASPLAATMIEGLTPDEIARMDGVEYQGIVCASMLADTPLGGFYVTNITDPAPFTGVIEMSALVDRAELGGNHLIYLPRYTTGQDPTMQASDDEIRSQFVAAVARMYPGFTEGNVLAFRVSRVRHVLPVPTIGYSERVPDMTTSVPSVFAVNSSQILNGTLNVNETIQLAARALPVISGDTAYTRSVLEGEVAPVLRGQP